MSDRRPSSSILVFQWLESIGLDYSIEHFRALGIDTPDRFAAFSLPDYDLVGVTDAEDRKRLFFLVQRVKVAMEERAKKKAEKQQQQQQQQQHHTTTSALGRSTKQPPAAAAAPAEGGAGLSRTMREQVLRVDLSAVHADAAEPAAHHTHHHHLGSTSATATTTPSSSGGARGPTAGRSPSPPQQRTSLDDSQAGLGLSHSATPSPFRHDVQLSAPPPPPAYYLPLASPVAATGPPATNKQLSVSSAAAVAGVSSPAFFSSPASVLSASTSAAVVASPEGPAVRTPSSGGARGLLSALGGASSHKRRASAQQHHHQQQQQVHFQEPTRVDGLVDMINDGPRDDMAIRVVVRKRPLTHAERGRGDTDIIESQPPQTVVVNEPKRQLDLTPFTESHYFVFDHSFDHLSPNEQIYGEVCLPLVAAMFRGGRSTCFAYGQTGSGKTFTMMGAGGTGHNERAATGQSPSLSATSTSPLSSGGGNSGLYELAAQDIFQVMAHPRFAAKGWSLHVSFYEIYGGKLFDLLNRRGVVRCLEDAKQQVQFLGLSEKHVRNVEELLGIMAEGQRQRSTGSTAANADSSRSHAVLQLSLKAPTASTSSPTRTASGNKGGSGGAQRGAPSSVRVIRESGAGGGGGGAGGDGKGRQPVVGTFSFIDLAGSERGADTRHADKATRLEGAEINTSLLALKEVIRALDKKQTHTPFRGSKLTQVLKDSLVGANARTVMIACIAPSLSSCEHTLNTLRYADRVKEQDATQQQQQQQASGSSNNATTAVGLGSTMAGTLRSTASTTAATASPAPTNSSSISSSKLPTFTRESSFSASSSPHKTRAHTPAAPTGAGCVSSSGDRSGRSPSTTPSSTDAVALASALQEAKEVQMYVQQLKEMRLASRQRRSSQSQSQTRLLQSLSSSSSSSSGSGGEGLEAEMDERQQQLEAYWEATQGLLETHKHAHVQLLSHLREEVDLLHVTDGDRGSLEAYLESVERLLEEQDQELERIQAHLEHVKAAKVKLLG